MGKLYCQLVVDALNEYSYFAEVAGLGYGLTITQEGLRVLHKPHNILTVIVDNQGLQLQTKPIGWKGYREDEYAWCHSRKI